MKLDATSAKLVLGSPSTSAETLADIARDFPELRAQVAAHPNAHPELLAWLAASGVPEAQAAAASRLASATAAPPVPTLIPEPPFGVQPPSHRGRSVVLAVALVAAAALVVWLLTGPLAHRGQPLPTASTPPASAEPTIQTGPARAAQWLSVSMPTAANATAMGPLQILDAGNNLVAVYYQYSTDQGGCVYSLSAASATNWASSWGWSLDCDVSGGVDVVAGNGMIAAVGDDQVHLINASSGQEIYSLPFAAGDSLIGLVGSVLLIGDGTTILAHSTGDLGTAWQADRWLPADMIDPLFGGGRWIDTNHGVLETATGQPAPFGSDAGISPDGTSYVYYDGPNETDVLRHSCTQRDCSLTLWDPVNDTARATVMSATADSLPDHICMDPASDFFVTITSDPTSGAATHTMWSWQTGMSLGGMGSGGTAAACGWFAGDSYLYQNPDDSSVSVFDAKNFGGVIVSAETTVASSQGIAYLADGTTMSAYDGNNGFVQLWSTQLPAAGAELQSAAGYLFATRPSSGQVWVLSS